MIKFIDIDSSDPYKEFLNFYELALKSGQDYIEAISISSFSKECCEVRSRFVNLKYVKKDEWVFFTNYKSPKNEEFENHNQISCIFFWGKINTQIRIKANIRRLSDEDSDNYFKTRSIEKNALAISSDQSQDTESYQQVVDSYNKVLNSDKNLKKRPIYWGGYSFKPYYFEFWEGHNSRLNKRKVFKMKENVWNSSFLQP
tara:strand:- start:3962 stop:4561 length:600 start_codon:yes stop_codon:yes gene_type:complete